MDRLTARLGRNPIVPGLVNINTAPAAVIAALPGIDGDMGLAQQIVEARTGLSDEARGNTAWLFTEGLLEADPFKAVAPYLATRGYQYRVRCIGFGVPCGRYRVIEAVIDITGTSPRISYLRDITRLGVPFKLDAEKER